MQVWVRGAKADSPFKLILSSSFYNNIVREQLPHLASRFTRVDVPTKDGSLVGWALDYSPAIGQAQADSDDGDKGEAGGGEARKNSITPTHKRAKIRKNELKNLVLADLEPRSLHWALADVHNFEIYAEEAQKVPHRLQFETALLLGDRVILHCADLYRRGEVLALLEEFARFVESGKVVFLLGRSVGDIAKTFPAYLEMRSSIYKQAEQYSADDIELLQSKLADKTYLERVVGILTRSPVRVHRGFVATDRFSEEIVRDLQTAEALATDSTLATSKLAKTNLTLFQLLHVRSSDEEGNSKEVYGSKAEITNAIDAVVANASKHSFSRQIILGLLREQLPDSLHPESFLERAIRTRLSLVHLRINVGPNAFLEFHPDREKSSPFYHQHLLNHLSALADVAPHADYSSDMVRDLLHLDSWKNFVEHHLASMSDCYARRLGDLRPQVVEQKFRSSRDSGRFDDIRGIVNDYWE